MSEKMLRLGLIGAGRWGKNYVTTLAGMAGAEIARVATRENWREVAAAKDLDGVIIATPARLHAEMAAVALAAGRPVMIEKPLTMDAKEAAELLALAREKNGFVLVDHIHLFHPGYVALKEHARALGPVRAIVSAGGGPGPFETDKPPLWEYGAHDVSLALDLMGEAPRAARAKRTASEDRPGGRGENFELELEFADGAAARIKVGNLFNKKIRSLSVQFETKSLILDDGAEPVLKLVSGDQSERLPFPEERPLNRAIASFLAAVRAGSKDLSSLELGVRVVEVLARCEEAAG